jgi:O-antigen/teichoic acid export membrane protein
MDKVLTERSDEAAVVALRTSAPQSSGREFVRGNQPALTVATTWRSSVAGWVSNTTFAAFVDQGFYSGTTFCTSVLIGRFAGKDALGLYALAFSVAVLVMCAHETLVTTPYTIFVHRRHATRVPRMAGSVFAMYLALAVAAAVGFLIVGSSLIRLNQQALAVAMLTLAGVAPLMLLRELARKMAYAHLLLRKAILVDAGVCLLQLGAMATLAFTGRLTAVTALMAVGLACGVAGGLWAATIWRSTQLRKRQVGIDMLRHWRLGRWIFAALISFMMQSSLLLWLIAFMLGEGSSGVFAASLTIIALANPLVGAIGIVFTPQASRALHQGGCAELQRVAFARTAQLAALAGLFSLAIALFGQPLLSTVYGPEYARLPWMIILLGATAFLKAVEMIAYNGLFVLERAQINLWINAANLLLLAITAPVLILNFGLTGAAAAMLLIALIGTLLRWCVFVELLRSGQRIALQTG